MNYRIFLTLGLLIVVILAFSTMGCEQKTISKSSTLPMEDSSVKAVFGYTMTLDFDKRNSYGDSDVWITVWIKNVSDQTRSLGVLMPPNNYIFTVLDSDGKVVPKLRYQVYRETALWNASGHGYDIKPGERFGVRFNLSKRFDLSVMGTYTVQCYRNVGRLGKNGKYEFEKLFSLKETFTIKSFGHDGLGIPPEVK